MDTAEEAAQAVADGADYLGFGPVYPTGSKSDAGPVVGLEGLQVSLVQGFESLQLAFTALPEHVPPEHVSPMVHDAPSSHESVLLA